MAVLLADRMLGARARTLAGADTHGDRYATSWGPLRGPWPGRAMEGPDVPVGQSGGRTWRLAADPEAWPLAPGDLIEEISGSGTVVRDWLVTSADLLHHSVDPAVDYIRVEAHIRTGTTAGQTRP
jgi:hypothetical protein